MPIVLCDNFSCINNSQPDKSRPGKCIAAEIYVSFLHCQSVVVVNKTETKQADSADLNNKG